MIWNYTNEPPADPLVKHIQAELTDAGIAHPGVAGEMTDMWRRKQWRLSCGIKDVPPSPRVPVDADGALYGLWVTNMPLVAWWILWGGHWIFAALCRRRLRRRCDFGRVGVFSHRGQCVR